MLKVNRGRGTGMKLTLTLGPRLAIASVLFGFASFCLTVFFPDSPVGRFGVALAGVGAFVACFVVLFGSHEGNLTPEA